MGADGFIVDPYESFSFTVRCYKCGRAILDYEPAYESHHGCRDKDGRVPVNLHIENYEER